jgi:hypothetical protein
MRFEQTNGIVELTNRSQGYFRRPSAVEEKCPGAHLKLRCNAYSNQENSLYFNTNNTVFENPQTPQFELFEPSG